MRDNFDRYNDYVVFFAGSEIFHSGSKHRGRYWVYTRCGFRHWGTVPYRRLDPTRVRPCKRCYP